MFTIPAGVIFIWTGTNASIPAGWVRETSLDSKFLKGAAAGVNPNATGGAATHTHTSPAHTHTIDAHTHIIYLSGASGTNRDSGSGNGGALNGHTHNGGALASGAVSSPSISSNASTYSVVSNNPPYYSVIFIKPSVGANAVPNLAVALYDNARGSLTGWYTCDGASGTPNLQNKYLIGAGAGADAGATGGGLTNTHTITHSHTTSHAHGSTVTAGADQQDDKTSGSDMASAAHTHTLTPNAYAGNATDSPTTLMDESVEPAYKKLMAIQNRIGNADVKLGLMAMWLGTLANIPTNWILCDGANGTQDTRSQHLKIGSSAEVGATGGSNTHTHASKSHVHTIGSHSHTVPTVSFGNDARHQDNGHGGVSNHSHTASTSATTLSLASGATTADSTNNEPEYRTTAFIRLASLAGGGAFFLTMMY